MMDTKKSWVPYIFSMKGTYCMYKTVETNDNPLIQGEMPSFQGMDSFITHTVGNAPGNLKKRNRCRRNMFPKLMI